MNLLARFTRASNAPGETPVTPSHSPEYSDAAMQRELTVELTRLLERRPASPRAITKTPCEFDDPDEAVDATLSGIDSPGSGSIAAASMSPPPLPGAYRAPEDLSAGPQHQPATQAESSTTRHRSAEPARWVATSKRARFNTGVRKAASWMISIFAGIFIFAVVALIVLGPPKDYDKLIEWPSKAIALSSTDMTPTLATRTASELETRSVKIHQFRLSQDEPAGGLIDQGR